MHRPSRHHHHADGISAVAQHILDRVPIASETSNCAQSQEPRSAAMHDSDMEEEICEEVKNQYRIRAESETRAGVRRQVREFDRISRVKGRIAAEPICSHTR